MQPDTLLNGRYRIIEPVGEGGMATVYRAQDLRLGRNVAIKVLHPEFARDKPFLQRFEQEAEFAASLGAHPNIVDIYDIGEDGDAHFIVMEFVEGRSLKDLIAEEGQFSVPQAFAIGQQVASALDFAHKRGLIHRDVKPQNILVTPEGMAKVTDFGIARSASASQLTRTGMVLGTVHYFSPEQAQGKPATPQSDIYSLGVILYEMLTGHLPFDAENAIGVAMQHIHSEPPSPWDYNPDLPARAVSTVMRALEKEPEARYRDAAEFAAALGTQVPATPGQTTMLVPAVEPTIQQTAVYAPVEAAAPLPPPAPRVVTPVEPQEQAIITPPRNRALMGLAAVLFAIIVATLAFFFTTHYLGGTTAAPPTATPTVTATPKPKHHKTKKPVVVRVTVAPTAVPTVAPTVPPTLPPTVAPTVPPPTPTPTPKPKPKPKPTPTPTPVPPAATPTPTPIPVQPALSPTAVG